MLSEEKIKGCLWGVAVGDAIGQPVEFMRLEGIKSLYGEKGIQEVPCIGIWTDDTEMTIANIRALSAFGSPGNLLTVNSQKIGEIFAQSFIEWLRKPGCAPGMNTKKSVLTLREIGPENWKNRKENNSKGCGTAMRAAPIGLWFADWIGEEDYKRKFIEISEVQSELTHGHKAATAAALASSYAVALAINGTKPSEMIHPIHELCSSIHPDFDAAMERLEESLESQNSGDWNDIDALSNIGEGWVGEEALALALYSAIQHEDDFKECMRLSVNHSGDSDSVGCIAGSIVGAYLGIDSIPNEWIENLEEKERYRSIVHSVCDLLMD